MKQINSVTLGILFMLAFAIIGPLIDLFAKLASAEVPIGQIILSRFVLQGFVLLPVAIILSLAHRPTCLLYTSPSPRDRTRSRMPSSA